MNVSSSRGVLTRRLPAEVPGDSADADGRPSRRIVPPPPPRVTAQDAPRRQREPLRGSEPPKCRHGVLRARGDEAARRGGQRRDLRPVEADERLSDARRERLRRAIEGGVVLSVQPLRPRDVVARRRCKCVGLSRHARFRRGISDAAPLPTHRWHARTFAPGDVRGARRRAADLVDRIPFPRICRGSANGRRAPSRAPRRSPSRSSGLGGRERELSAEERRSARRRVRVPSLGLRLVAGQLWYRNKNLLATRNRRSFSASATRRACLEISIEDDRLRPCSLPLRLSSPNAPAPSRGTARGSRDLPTGRRDGPLSAEACLRSSRRRRS